ncbi:MAG: sensor histidine kinase [Chloroflexota bacterium]
MEKLTDRFPALKKFSMLNASPNIVLIAVAIPSLIAYFSESHEYRWIALGLFFIFGFFLSVREQALRFSQLSPAVYLGIQTIVIVSLLALPPHYPFTIILFFIISAEASMLYPTRISVLWIFLYIIITAVFIFYGQGTQAAIYSLPIYAGGYIFFAAFAASTAKAERARAESQALLGELREAHKKLQVYAAQAESLAVAEERNRMAREMHDTLGHRLTVAIVQLEGAQRLTAEDPSRAVEIMGTVHQQMREALGELRSTVATLREPLEADLSLTSALKRLGDDFQKATEIEVKMIFAYNLPEFPDAYRVAIYRGAQEGLTNIQRHAQADSIHLRLALDDVDGVRLQVSDNGIGIPADAQKMGFGLLGLQERAEQLNGEMRLEANPDGGAQICLCLPWPLDGENE